MQFLMQNISNLNLNPNNWTSACYLALILREERNFLKHINDDYCLRAGKY